MNKLLLYVEEKILKHVNQISIIGVTPNKNIERREIFYDEWNHNYGILITFKREKKSQNISEMLLRETNK